MDFRDRHVDWGARLVLWAARRQTGLRLRELSVAAGGLDYRAVAMAVQRLPARARKALALGRAVRRLACEW